MVLAGEITTAAVLDFAAIARQVICDIGYDTGDFGFDGNAVGVITALDRQSPDIARGVAARTTHAHLGSTDPFDSAGAGDQGMMFGYATQRDARADADADRARAQAGPAARAGPPRRAAAVPAAGRQDPGDGALRRGGQAVRVEKVLISTQHEDGVEAKLPDALWEQVVTQALPPDLYDPAALRREFYVNPTGRFVIGGPVGDTGLTGRKIIVDTYGGFARHGGGAFSGKDPSKVDRSASYAARHVAKNIVAAGLADRAEVQVAYAIGVARPLSLLIETFGTEKIDRAMLAGLVRDHFDLRPAALVEKLNLRRPIYRQTAAYGHFGRDESGLHLGEHRPGRRPPRGGGSRLRSARQPGPPGKPPHVPPRPAVPSVCPRPARSESLWPDRNRGRFWVPRHCPARSAVGISALACGNGQLLGITLSGLPQEGVAGAGRSDQIARRDGGRGRYRSGPRPCR